MAKVKSEAPWLTYLICFSLGVIYLAEVLVSPNELSHLSVSTATLIDFGALNKTVIARTGEWYRIVSAPFINGSLTILLFNAAALFVMGAAFERLVGRSWLFAFVLIAGLSGSLCSLLLNNQETTSAGSSGIVTGLFISLYILAFRLPKPDQNALQIRTLIVMAIFLWPMINAAAKHQHVFNYGAHLGGFLTGTVVGGIFLKVWQPNETIVPLRRVALLLTLVGVALLSFTIVCLVAHYPINQRLT